MDPNKEDKKAKYKKKKKKVCVFCATKKVLDYKDLEFVRKFISERGKILPRRASGCCAKHQRRVAMVIKRVRHLGLVPFLSE